MFNTGYSHRNLKGHICQAIYLDKKVPLFGVLKETKLSKVILQPSAHIPYTKIGDLATVDVNEFIKRLNDNQPTNVPIDKLRELSDVEDTFERLFGFDPREAPNIPEIPDVHL